MAYRYQPAAQRAGGPFSSRYKFNGKELDKQTGYYYYGARYYDPVLSRWLSVDPLVEKYPGLSPYNYTADNPVMVVDPDRKRTEPPVNGLPFFSDDTGDYYWNDEKQMYEHFSVEDDSGNSVFLGYYSADEFVEPKGDYKIDFNSNGLEQYDPSKTIWDDAEPFLLYLYLEDASIEDISNDSKYPGVKILHTNLKSMEKAGVTFGNLIIVGDGYDDDILDHEYGHFLDYKYHFKYNQSEYLNQIGLPSFLNMALIEAGLTNSYLAKNISSIFCPEHENSVPEKRANRLGGAWSSNEKLKNRFREDE